MNIIDIWLLFSYSSTTRFQSQTLISDRILMFLLSTTIFTKNNSFLFIPFLTCGLLVWSSCRHLYRINVEIHSSMDQSIEQICLKQDLLNSQLILLNSKQICFYITKKCQLAYFDAKNDDHTDYIVNTSYNLSKVQKLMFNDKESILVLFDAQNVYFLFFPSSRFEDYRGKLTYFLPFQHFLSIVVGWTHLFAYQLKSPMSSGIHPTLPQVPLY